MATIRHATVDDIPGIASVIEESFNEKIDQNRCRTLIESKKQHIWVAVEDDVIVGIISAFSTTVQGAVRRWEIDLVAVRDANQGKKLSRQLIDASWKDARQHKVNFARALVRLDNVAAQRTFQNAGYATSGQVYDMIYWGGLASDTQIPKLSFVSATHVDTLIYRGIWLEGLHMPLISDEDRIAYIAGARAVVANDNLAYTSALVPADNPLKPDVLGDGRIQAQFQWWRKP